MNSENPLKIPPSSIPSPSPLSIERDESNIKEFNSLESKPHEDNEIPQITQDTTYTSKGIDQVINNAESNVSKTVCNTNPETTSFVEGHPQYITQEGLLAPSQSLPVQTKKISQADGFSRSKIGEEKIPDLLEVEPSVVNGDGQQEKIPEPENRSEVASNTPPRERIPVDNGPTPPPPPLKQLKEFAPYLERLFVCMEKLYSSIQTNPRTGIISNDTSKLIEVLTCVVNELVTEEAESKVQDEASIRKEMFLTYIDRMAGLVPSDGDLHCFGDREDDILGRGAKIFGQVLVRRANERPNAFSSCSEVRVSRLERVLAASKQRFQDQQNTINTLKQLVEAEKAKGIQLKIDLSQELANQISATSEYQTQLNQTTSLNAMLDKEVSILSDKLVQQNLEIDQLRQSIQPPEDPTKLLSSDEVHRVLVDGKEWIYLPSDLTTSSNWWQVNSLQHSGNQTWQRYIDPLPTKVIVAENVIASLQSACARYKGLVVAESKRADGAEHEKKILEKQLKELQVPAEQMNIAISKPEEDTLSTSDIGQCSKCKQKMDFLLQEIKRLEKQAPLLPRSSVESKFGIEKGLGKRDSSIQKECYYVDDQLVQILQEKDLTIAALEKSLVEKMSEKRGMEPTSRLNNNDLEQEQEPVDDDRVSSRSGTDIQSLGPGCESDGRESSAATSKKDLWLDYIRLHEKLGKLEEYVQNLKKAEQEMLDKEDKIHRQLYLKNTLVHFLKTDPTGSEEHEGLIPVLVKLLNLSRNEIEMIQSSRGRQNESLSLFRRIMASK